MKKKFLVGIMVAIVLFMGSYCFAYDDTMKNDILTYQTINDSGIYENTLVPVTSIYPLIDNVLGFSIMKHDLTKNAEQVVALYDQTSTTITNTSGECLGESETTTGLSDTIWYPYPRILNYGLLVRQGPNTVVTIYFSRR